MNILLIIIKLSNLRTLAYELQETSMTNKIISLMHKSITLQLKPKGNADQPLKTRRKGHHNSQTSCIWQLV